MRDDLEDLIIEEVEVDIGHFGDSTILCSQCYEPMDIELEEWAPCPRCGVEHQYTIQVWARKKCDATED